jgi:hypothetical protein
MLASNIGYDVNLGPNSYCPGRKPPEKAVKDPPRPYKTQYGMKIYYVTR